MGGDAGSIKSGCDNKTKSKVCYEAGARGKMCLN